MAGKFIPLIFAALILVSVSGAAAAATCGDGRCDSSENCYTCSNDCGDCKGSSCVSNDDCATGICCNYICDSSCVIYPPEDDQFSGNISVSAPENIIIFEIAVLLVVTASIVHLLLKRRKSDKVN